MSHVSPLIFSFERILDSLYRYQGYKSPTFLTARDLLMEEYGREVIRALLARYAEIGLDTGPLSPEDMDTRHREDVDEKD